MEGHTMNQVMLWLLQEWVASPRENDPRPEEIEIIRDQDDRREEE
jgi:hypothetical protein